MDQMECIQKLAMLAVVEPDYDAFVRRICRWYSKTFHSPLYEVEQLPFEEILQHYFEQTFEDLSTEEKHNKIIYLLETPSERRARELADKEQEDDLMKILEEEAIKQNAKNLKTNYNKSIKPEITKELPKQEELPEVSIRFIDSEAMDDLLSQENDPSPKKQS